VPYRDTEQRRACSRESKRRARARLAHPITKFKAYACVRHPFLRLGPGISFEYGLFVSDDKEIQARVEKSPHFGKDIIPLSIDTTCISTEDG